jgi:hypothetical protein
MLLFLLQHIQSVSRTKRDWLYCKTTWKSSWDLFNIQFIPKKLILKEEKKIFLIFYKTTI